MAELMFSEVNMYDDSIFKFEQRLNTSLNRYTENGTILTTYYSQDGKNTTTDRGIRDIDQLFGPHSPVRYNKIENLPMHAFNMLTPTNTDENSTEDINVESTAQIIPGTIVPTDNDMFLVKHLKTVNIFIVTNVEFDSMKERGNYRITFRLISTSEDRLQELERRTINRYMCDLNSIGTKMNPIIQKDDFVYREQVQMVLGKMVEGYRALFYNQRHNCFLYYDGKTGDTWYDMCGNEFMAKYSIPNFVNTTSIIMLNNKIQDKQFPLFYNNSIWNWIEMDCPIRLLQKFYFQLNDTNGYPTSTFARWGEDYFYAIQPIQVEHVGRLNQEHCYFSDETLKALMDETKEPCNEYEKLIWKYIHKTSTLTYKDIPLNIGDGLITSFKNRDIYLLTPMIIYIIRKILHTA